MSEPIRILQVFATMNRGGAESMIMNLYRQIDRKKIQFDFVVHTEDKCAFDDEIEQLGGNVHRIPRYNGKNHLTYIKAWKFIFMNHPEYKIIHGHIRSTAAIYLKIAKNYNVVTISHSHSTSSGSGITSVIKNIMQLPIRSISDYFFACSEEAGNWLFGKKIVNSGRFYVLNNAIDINLFQFDSNIRNITRNELNIRNKFVIGHVGRFHPTKNQAFLIEIFKVLHDKNQDTMLVLVGDGELKKSIQSKVLEANLESSIIFTGVRPDVNKLMQAMDLLVMPSIYEGLPVTLVEAQTSGLKCIVSDKITREINITDLVEFYPLDYSHDKWANLILDHMDTYKRRDTSEEIRMAGYDIEENSLWLERFYIKKLKLRT